MSTIPRVIAGLMLVSCAVSAKAADAAPSLSEGVYAPKGGRAQGGEVALSKSGQSYKLSWTVDKKIKQEGVGVLADGILTVGFQDKASQDFGVVSYRVMPDGSLQGKWTMSDGSFESMETLLPKGSTFSASATDLPKPAVKAGAYSLEATGDYGPFKGTGVVRKNGDIFRFTWHVGEHDYQGVGIQQGATLSVASLEANVGPGATAYHVDDGGHLEGPFTIGGKNGRETMVFQGAAVAAAAASAAAASSDSKSSVAQEDSQPNVDMSKRAKPAPVSAEQAARELLP